MEQIIGSAIRSSSSNNIQINKQICEFREEFAIQDNTPNEKRYIKDGQIDENIYYPLSDRYIYLNIYFSNKKEINLPIYACNETSIIDREQFHNKLKTDRIKYAIQYLQVGSLKKFIIKNYTSVLLKNPFYDLYYTKYPVNLNIDATKQIIEILIENYDDHYKMITELYTNTNKNNEYITELLYSYLPIDENNLCQFCLQTEPKKTLFNPCSCKIPIHAECILKLNNVKPIDKCKVCLSKYEINEPIYLTNSGIVIRQEKSNIFFPKFDLYYQPLSSNSDLVKVSGINRLTMAILYLQVNRVKELLLEPEIINNLDTYYFGYEGYKQTPLIALAQGNLPSNCHITFGNNIKKYTDIFKLLLDTDKINLEHKDAFDKNVYDYIANNKYDMIFGVLIKKYIKKEDYLRRLLKELNDEKREIKYSVKNDKYLYTIVYKNNKFLELNKFYKNAGFVSNTTKCYIYNNKKYNKLGKHICSIIDNINKLSDGKIKKYQIFNKLQLEFICKELTKQKILHTINIESKPAHPALSYNKLYTKYKEDEKQLWFNGYWDNISDELEYSKICKTKNMYIKVYKGFVNLCEGIKENPKNGCDYKYSIYIYN